MAVEIGTGTGNVDLTSLLKGTDMGNLLGGVGGSGEGLGGGLLLGLLLGRTNLLGGGAEGAVGAERAVDAAVAAALASSNQANNNAMLLLKDIQDSSQEVMSTITSGNQNLLTTSLQGQIANLQGQASILAGVESSKATVVNEIHESATDLGNGISALASSTAAAFGVVNTHIATQTATVLAGVTADAGLVKDVLNVGTVGFGVLGFFFKEAKPETVIN